MTPDNEQRCNIHIITQKGTYIWRPTLRVMYDPYKDIAKSCLEGIIEGDCLLVRRPHMPSRAAEFAVLIAPEHIIAIEDHTDYSSVRGSDDE